MIYFGYVIIISPKISLLKWIGCLVLHAWCHCSCQLIEAEWCIYELVNKPSLVQIMASRLVGAKPLSEPMLEYVIIGPLETKSLWNFIWNSYIFIQENVFENVICKVVAILSQPQCVNGHQMNSLKGCPNGNFQHHLWESNSQVYNLFITNNLKYDWSEYNSTAFEQHL